MRRFAALAVVAALAAGEFTCKKGAYEGTEILSIENVDDVEACQEYCKGIDGCASLTVAEGGSCVLYGRTAVLDADRKGQSCTQVAALLFECAAGKAFAGGVLTIGDIVTLDECKQQCASFAGVCQGVNYGSDQTCELVDSVDTYAETTDDRMTSCAVSSTSAAAATPRVSTFRCSGSASLEGDEILAFAGSSSVDECSASCEEVPGCNGFAVTSEECQLKSGRVTLAKAAGGRSPAVACVREGSAAEVPAVSGGADKYACSAGSVSYAGGDLLVAVGVKDSDECARLCSAHPDCALYVVSAKACTLKRDTAELVPNDSSAKSRFPVAGTACVRIDAVRVSPPSSSTDPFAGFGAVVDLQGAGGDLKLDVSAQFDCVDDAIFGGEVLGEFSVESVNECLTRCLIDANCDGAAMAADGKACKLGKHVATDTGAGETVCKKKTEEVAGYRCERSRAYAGATVATVGDVASVTACSSLCDAKPGCVIVVYNPETHLCLLKALHAAPLSATLESSTSCVSEKMTVQHGYHCSSAVSLPGGTLSLLSDMTLATCADQCERMVECATVQYTAASSSCELKSLDVRGVEMGAAGVVTCGKPSDPAARGDSSSRTASVLAADGAASLVAWVKLRFGLHVRGLDQAVFQVVPIANDTTFDDDVATLWFTVHVRVPVGMSPSSYGWAAFYAAANELNSANNIFQQSLNPILAAAGLAPLAPGPNGGWSLSHGGAEWLPAVLDSVEIPLVFKPLAGVDFLSDVERLALARYVATSLGFPASSVSTSAVYFCEDDAASTCSLEWRAAQADTAGGANALSSGAPATVKVRLVIDLPENATFSELCQNVSAVLCNETVLNETFYSTRFGLISCGDCDGGDGGEGEAPVDASDLMSTVSRRLLQVTESKLANALRPTTQPAGRRARALALDTAGTRPGLERDCVVGWQSSDYQVMSSLFDVTATAAEVTGTLTDCVEACTPEVGCFAFTRDGTLGNDESGLCVLKNTVLAVAGDIAAVGDEKTYVVACPDANLPCSWTFLDNTDIRGSSKVTASAYAASVVECKQLCAAHPSCVAVTFEKDTGVCWIVADLQTSLASPPEDSGFYTAVCGRTEASSPCDEGFCGVAEASLCIPTSAAEYACGCALGHECVKNCGATEPHMCTQVASLEDQLLAALAATLNVDAGGLTVSGYEAQAANTTRAPTTEVITVTTVRVNVPATHVFSVTFNEMTFTDLLGATTGLSKAHQLVDIITSELSPTGEVAIDKICMVYPDGSTGSCVDAAQNEIKSARPIVKVSVPSRNYQAAVDWCLSADPVALAEPQSLEQLEQLVFSSQGEMVETRKYWVGAKCDENCATASEWRWAIKSAAVDWAEMGVGELSDDAGCAVAAYDVQAMHWGLLAVPCDAKGNYPVCLELTESEDHAESCDSTNGCSLQMTLKMRIDHVRDVHFLTLPDGSTVQYHPALDLPAGTRIQKRDGTTLGYVSSNGKTSVIKYPPLDQPQNSALLDIMPSVTYVSEALSQYMTRNMQGWLNSVGLGSYSSACHDASITRHVKCVDLICTTVEPLIVRRTSCVGAPPCLDSGCSGNGFAKGFVGHCTCVCETGFGGETCGQCAMGYTNFPTCEESESGGADVAAQHEVIHLYLKSGADSVASNHEPLRDDLSTSIGFLADSYSVRYICPASVCADSYGGCYSPINTWSAARRGLCQRLGDDYGSTRRVAAMLANERGYFPLLADEESIAEVEVTYNVENSRKPAEASALLQSTLENYLDQRSGTFGAFGLTNVKSVFGPSSSDEPQLTPEAEPPVALGDTLPPAGEKGAGVDIVDGASSGVNLMVLVVIIISALFCCLLLFFACWRRRRNQMKKKRKTQDLMKKYTDEEEAEDVVIIYKDVDEPMGIMWDDHTLLVGVCEDSPAFRYNLDRFRNRRIAKVNGKEVKTLSDIRYAVQGQTVVTLEFEPRFSSIVVRVQTTMEEFNEQDFLQAFADRVSRALYLMDFTEMDLDLQSVVERGDRGELLLTTKLLGLTSDQVANVVAMCVTPGDPIRAGLPIVGAYLATGKGFHLSPPLWVCCQWLSEAAQAAGCYLQLPGVQEEGFPIWQHIPADHWMYSSAGHWVIVNDKSLVGQEVGGGYVVKSSVPHRGAMPYVINDWRTAARDNSQIVVSEDEPRAGEFVIGQKVVFPQDVELGDGAFINKKSEAIVMSQDGDDLIKVCLLNEEFDVVTVSPDVIDSPDGPRVTYLLDGKWMPCTIVKVRNEDRKTQLKLHFDCGLCQDLWIDKDEDKDKLKFPAQEIFAVGEQVQLAADAADEIEEDGCLTRNDIGVIVACGDLGQARPFLVEGPAELSWYAASNLTHIVPQQRELNTDAGNMSRASNDPFGNEHDE